MAELGKIDLIALILVVIGALNWGLIGIGYFFTAEMGLARVDLVMYIANALPGIGGVVYLRHGFAALIYLVVGLAGIYSAYFIYNEYAGDGSVSMGGDTSGDAGEEE